MSRAGAHRGGRRAQSSWLSGRSARTASAGIGDREAADLPGGAGAAVELTAAAVGRVAAGRVVNFAGMLPPFIRPSDTAAADIMLATAAAGIRRGAAHAAIAGGATVEDAIAAVGDEAAFAGAILDEIGRVGRARIPNAAGRRIAGVRDAADGTRRASEALLRTVIGAVAAIRDDAAGPGARIRNRHQAGGGRLFDADSGRELADLTRVAAPTVHEAAAAVRDHPALPFLAVNRMAGAGAALVRRTAAAADLACGAAASALGIAAATVGDEAASSAYVIAGRLTAAPALTLMDQSADLARRAGAAVDGARAAITERATNKIIVGAGVHRIAGGLAQAGRR